MGEGNDNKEIRKNTVRDGWNPSENEVVKKCTESPVAAVVVDLLAEKATTTIEGPQAG